MIVEFLDPAGDWHLFKGATVKQVEPGVYQVTVAGLAAMWLATPNLFDGMLLRLDGREARAVVDAKRERDVLVLRTFVDRSSPGASG